MNSRTAHKFDGSGWDRQRERGSLLALRVTAWIAVTLGRRVTRLLLPPIALYFLLAAGAARRNSARYLRRALGRPPTWRERLHHFNCFAATVLDRVYFVRGQSEEFDIDLRAEAECERILASGSGGFLLGAHLGSFESLQNLRNRFPGVRVAMVMYPDNARKLHSVLHAVAPEIDLCVIGIGNPGSTLAIRDAIAAGKMVGLLGDRFLHGAEAARTAVVDVPFLGLPAPFSDGPMRLAMLLNQRVIFMVGLYHGGRRYELRFETLADFRDPPSDRTLREQLIRQALHAYVARLEQLCREAPFNWFNFHDYWQEGRAN